MTMQSSPSPDSSTPTRTRTEDPRIKSPLLCQLSYGSLVLIQSFFGRGLGFGFVLHPMITPYILSKLKL